MTRIKVYARKIKRTHDGYCTENGDDLYDKPTLNIFMRKFDVEIPQEQWEDNGIDLKEEYWYKYVPWFKDEIKEEIEDEYHCLGCCHATGIIYDIYKVQRVNVNTNTNDET